MIKLCINCNTENPFEAVICSECGMSLTRVLTAQTIPRARVAIIAAVCWSVLALYGCVWVAGIWSIGTGGYMDREMQQWALDVGNTVVAWGFALASAPWVIGGIAFGVRWWRSITQGGHQSSD